MSIQWLHAKSNQPMIGIYYGWLGQWTWWTPHKHIYGTLLITNALVTEHSPSLFHHINHHSTIISQPHWDKKNLLNTIMIHHHKDWIRLWSYSGGLMQKRHNSTAIALDLCFYCNKSFVYSCHFIYILYIYIYKQLEFMDLICSRYFILTPQSWYNMYQHP